MKTSVKVIGPFRVVLLLVVGSLWGMGCQADRITEDAPALGPDEPLAVIPEAVWSDFERQPTPEYQADFLLDMIAQNYASKPRMSLVLAEQAEAITQTASLRTHYAQALYWKAYLLNRMDPENVGLQRALADTKISIDILEEQPASVWLARALNLRALIHYNLYEEAIGWTYNRQAEDVLATLATSADPLCSDWGNIHRTAGNILLYTTERTDSVLHRYDLAKAEYLACRDTNRLARLMMNYAIVHEAVGDYSLADSLMQRGIFLSEQQGDSGLVAKAYLDFATFHSNRFQNSDSARWMRSSERLLDRVARLQPNVISEVYYQRGANYHNFALRDTLRSELLFDSATYYYDLAIEAGLAEGNANYLQQTEEQIAKICPDIGPDVCSKLLAKSTLANEEISRQTRLSFQDAAAKREVFRLNVEAEKRRQILIWSGLLALGVVGLFVGLYQRSRVVFLQEQLQNRMEALRAQMNPHFISNSLNAIDSLVNKGKQEEASEYLIDFSRLCRLILNNSKADLISLDKEIETLGYYLSLEKLRMGNRLNYRFDIDEELSPATIQVPPLLLQPFIENAIIHGIQNKQVPGHIDISIRPYDSHLLEVRITDDGVGRDRARAIRSKSVLGRPSLGVSITEERLETMKKMKGARIQYHDLVGAEGRVLGTEVIIQFPLIFAEPC